MLRTEREEIRVVADRIGSPTWTGDIASLIAQLIPQLKYPDKSGTYNYEQRRYGAGTTSPLPFEEARALGFGPARDSHYYRRLSTPQNVPPIPLLDCAKMYLPVLKLMRPMATAWANVAKLKKPILYEAILSSARPRPITYKQTAGTRCQQTHSLVWHWKK